MIYFEEVQMFTFEKYKSLRCQRKILYGFR